MALDIPNPNGGRIALPDPPPGAKFAPLRAAIVKAQRIHDHLRGACRRETETDAAYQEAIAADQEAYAAALLADTELPRADQQQQEYASAAARATQEREATERAYAAACIDLLRAVEAASDAWRLTEAQSLADDAARLTEAAQVVSAAFAAVATRLQVIQVVTQGPKAAVEMPRARLEMRQLGAPGEVWSLSGAPDVARLLSGWAAALAELRGRLVDGTTTGPAADEYLVPDDEMAVTVE